MSHACREKLTDSYTRVVPFYMEFLTAMDLTSILRIAFAVFTRDLQLAMSGTQN